MARIPIKPLSVNRAWQGKRYKTLDYMKYEHEVSLLLPKNYSIPGGKLRLELNFGLSNTMSDLDNPVKPFLDILQKKYNFNDRMVYEMVLKKEIVKKGEEYIDFSISNA